MKNLKKFLALALALCMILSLVPMTVFAEETAAVEQVAEPVAEPVEAAVEEPLFNFEGDGAVRIYEGDDFVHGYDTLQAALDDAIDGDTVRVMENLTGNVYETEAFKNSTIYVEGAAADTTLTSTSGSAGFYYGDWDASNRATTDTLHLSNITMTKSGGNYTTLVDALTGTLTNVTINGDKNTAFTAANGAQVTLENCTFANTGYNKSNTTSWRDSALTAQGIGEGPSILTVKSGSYTSANGYAVYIFSSGGIVNLEGGTFQGKLIAQIDRNTYHEDYNSSIINISGGTFTDVEFITSGAAGYAEINITGGTFDADPTDYVEDGYEAVNNGNGTWTVQEDIPNVAVYNGDEFIAGYDTLAEAINADSTLDGYTVKVMKDLTTSTWVYITDSFKGKTLNIVGVSADTTMTSTGHNFGFYLGDFDASNNPATDEITITDITMSKSGGNYTTLVDALTGTINNVTINSDKNTAFTAANGAQVTLENCTFANTGYNKSNTMSWRDAALSAQGIGSGPSVLTVKSGTYTSANGYAAYIFSSGGIINIEDGTFQGKLKADIDRKTYHEDYNRSIINISGGTFTDVEFITSGAAEYAQINISGGTFDADPTAYVVDGYKAVDNSNGTWTVLQDGVAEIGNTRYATLQEAFDAVQDNETIVLLGDLTQEYGVDFNRDVTATFDLGGHTFTVTKGGSAHRSRNVFITAGDLTITNGTMDAHNETAINDKSHNTGNYPYGTVRTENDAKATLEDLTLINNHCWGLNVKACDSSEVVIRDCTINSTYGGGFEAAGGKITVYDSTFNQSGVNTAYTWIASAITVSCDKDTGDIGEVNVYNTTFEATAECAIYVYSSGGTINVYSGVFNGNNRAVTIQHDSKNYGMFESVVNIYGGEVNGSFVNNNTAKDIFNVSGGLFDHDPSAYVVDGYEAVLLESGENAGKWLVGKVETTATTTGDPATDDEVTYTVNTVVMDGDEEIDGTQIQQSVTVTGTTEVTFEAADANAMGAAELSQFDAEEVANIVSSAVQAAGEDAADVDSIKVVLVGDTAVDNTAEATPSITYEVHPEAIAFKNDEKVGTYAIGNDQLKEGTSFTFDLAVPDALVAGANSYVKVTHVSEGYADEVDYYPVQGTAGNYFVTVTVTHFSEFELTPVDVSIEGDCGVSASLTLGDNISINLYVKNLAAGTNAEDYTVSYTFYGENTSSASNLPLGTADANGRYMFRVAECAAKEMIDTVNFKVTYTNPVTHDATVIKNVDYSIRQYCRSQIDDNSDSALTDLCRSVLDYGTRAQYYFGYKVMDLATAGDYGTAAYEIAETYIPSAPVSVEKGDGVSKISASLTLEYKTQINIYFYNGNASLPVSVTAVNGSDFTYDVTDTGNGRVRVAIKGIAAKDLNDTFQVTLGESRVDYSPLSYMYINDGTDQLGMVCKTLYRYFEAASAYFE